MDELTVDNILTDMDIENLFVDKQAEPPEEKQDEPQEKQEPKEEEVNVDTLFDGDNTVAEPKNDKEIKTPDSTSSNNNSIFSSITQALVDEGVFSELNEEVIKGTNSAEAFKKLIEDKIQEGLDETQKRINKALGVGVEPDDITNYENTLYQLNNITDELISKEDEQGENLRKQLIYQDYINRGFSQEKAQKEVKKSLNAGTDIEDAKEALESNKDFFKTQYDKLIDDAEKQKNEKQKEIDDSVAKLKKSILEDKDLFGDYEIDKNTRQRIVDNISKPTYRDPKTGKSYTAIQRYELENKVDFVKNLGIIFTLTDGFKNLDGFTKGKVRKEVKKGLAELENTLNNTNRNSDGTLNFANGGDPNSFLSKGWKFDF
jgi:hypothetical protein